MIFCVQAHLVFDLATRRDVVFTLMTTRIVSRQRWSVDSLYTSTSKDGFPSIRCELRFVTRVDQEDLRDFVEANATGANAPRAGSWLRIHNCSHDAVSPTPCVVAGERVW